MTVQNLDFGFLDRTLRTTGVVLLLYLPFGLYYFGLFPTLAIFSGGIWGMLNFIFISALVRAAIRVEGTDIGRAVILSLIKFPLLYGAGYFLLKVSQFEAWHLLIGFTSLLAIMVLKVLGRLFLRLDESNSGDKRLRRAN